MENENRYIGSVKRARVQLFKTGLLQMAKMYLKQQHLKSDIRTTGELLRPGT